MIRSIGHCASRPPSGFTLVEALVAISITAVAGSVLLLGVNASLQTTDDALRQTIALGLAQRLMNEVAGAASIEEIDKYDAFRSQPPKDAWGIPLGSEDGKGGQRPNAFQMPAESLSQYAWEVRIHRVDPTDLTARLAAGAPSDYRLVEVCVTHHGPNSAARELARVQRVVAYVPPY